MKKPLKLLLSIILVNSSMLINSCQNNINSVQGSAINQQALSGISKNLIVRYKSNITPEQIKQFNSSLGINSFEMISNELKLTEIKVNTLGEFSALKEKFNKSNLIEYVDGDSKLSIFPYKVYNVDSDFSTKAVVGARPNDSFFGLQWNVGNIDADKAWTLTTGSHDVKVAVIDSGVDPDHPDLKDNLLPLIDMWNAEDEKDIYSTGGENIDYTGKDGNGHGTHVTGILGAIINNSKGIAGISGNVTILPIKAANHEGNTSASIITKSIIRAIDEGAKVINLSIGGPKSEGTQQLQDAVNLALEKGVVFVSATGNESNRSNKTITEVTVPAAYPGVLAVAANTKFDKVANYSNGGPEVEITAPGGGGLSSEGDKIYSTWPTYKTFEGYRAGIKGPYALLSGTSMSCPHVSAVAALLLTKEPYLTAQQVRVRILSSTTDIDAKGFDYATGFGKINAYQALITSTDDKKNKENL
jgi:subtilisin family serine protease